MEFLKKVVLAAAAVVMPVSAFADQEVAAYFVELGPQDFYNSSGKRLTDGGSIFQQDRANYHRFKIRHGGDQSDPVFGKSANRALIPELMRKGSNTGFLQSIARLDPATAARPGYAEYRIFVCANNGRLTRMILNYADGDGYNGC